MPQCSCDKVGILKDNYRYTRIILSQNDSYLYTGLRKIIYEYSDLFIPIYV
jgi:hypothetical protein